MPPLKNPLLSRTHAGRRDVEATKRGAEPILPVADPEPHARTEELSPHQDLFVRHIRPNPRSRRGPVVGPDAPKAEVEKTQELAASIEQHGLLHPIGVMPIADGFEVLYGDRRLAAHVLRGWTSIRCTVFSVSEPARARALTITENGQRHNPNPMARSLEHWDLCADLFGVPLGGELTEAQIEVVAAMVHITARSVRRILEIARPGVPTRGPESEQSASSKNLRRSRMLVVGQLKALATAELSSADVTGVARELTALRTAVDRALKDLSR